ncbi:glycosyltransferase family 4 protein [Actinomycetes bacterium NPDC127524]|uniref:glycosyltransferase family 4 protein n=1 Tax=unclassified Bacillus (in: firmicutes) TaxID=185979 RepID=UPI0008F31B1B|nr:MULTISPECIES: MraY family glycosyltransferase [unclassified Bacillus (in: firmicutes)]OIK11441.1 undecaprenyl-phosphate alpha-N-acetylglucosaminyl 1-phosphate transferase [Bacillus sp. MUM 13]SFC23777.1 UDP-GlcNAc:undecaprenyl-phosphate GlcNAc-1-phosphate transferase [Bacillus sp. OV322]
MLIGALLTAFFLSIVLTPFVSKLAFKWGATDKPNERKVHQKIMPRMGGLAIFLSFAISFLIFRPDVPNENYLPILAGACLIVLIGIFDDIYELSAKMKLAGQVGAALIIIFWGGIQVQFINLPFGGELEFGALSIPITIIWIVGVTNAINLIDGLDGLAAGVSSIALVTISVMALVMGDIFVATISLIVTGSSLGFLKYNFHPAKIFMGDTGSLFLGYIIAVLSLLGFKNITVISLIVPIIILGVPISDTIFAIIRRLVNKTPISAPDKSHLHHCLVNVGFSHKQTVVLIYALAASFGLAAIIFSFATQWGALLIVAILLITIEIIVEKVGLIGSNYQPLLKMFAPRKEKP